MKKNFHLRLVAMLMCILLLCTACNTSTNGTATSETDKSAVQTTTTADNTSNDLVEIYISDKVISENPITLTAVTPINNFVKSDIGTFAIWDLLEKATNVHWEVEGIPENSYADKVTLMISGNDLPDVLFAPRADIQGKYYNTGLFLALDEMIETEAPAIAELLSDPVIRANIASPDGKIYVTPAGEIAPWLDDGNEIFINGQWLEKLNLEVPTDLDGFYNVLKAFKEQDPNGNSLPDELPLSMSIKRGDLLRFMGMFGLPINANYEMQRDEKYIYGPTQDAFRAGLEYFHKLYADGLLDPESLTQERPELMAKGASDPTVVGTLIGFWPNDYCTPEVSALYVPVLPLSGGTDGKPEWLNAANMPYGGGMVITTNCKYPKEALRWANYISEDPARTMEIVWGPLDLNILAITEDGKYKENVGAEPEGMTYNEWTYSNTVRLSIPWFMTQESVLAVRDVSGEAAYKLDIVDQYRPYFYNDILTTAHVNNYESEELRQEAVTISTDLKTIVDEFVAQSLMNGITDDSWAAFQKTLSKANVEKFIEIRQKSLDKFYASIK